MNCDNCAWEYGPDTANPDVTGAGKSWCLRCPECEELVQDVHGEKI